MGGAGFDPKWGNTHGVAYQGDSGESESDSEMHGSPADEELLSQSTLNDDGRSCHRTRSQSLQGLFGMTGNGQNSPSNIASASKRTRPSAGEDDQRVLKKT